MTEYRWNQSELAAGYDAGAALVHPHYVAVQDAILERLPFEEQSPGLVVDLGGGSGRLVERVLDRWSGVQAHLVDQSQAFLDIAKNRLLKFENRVSFACCKLQDNWRNSLPAQANAIVSMSAIHHLDAEEKQACYQRCFDALSPGGILLNGDEVRPESETDYRHQVNVWAAHMDQLISDETVTPAMAGALHKWRQRNVDEFDTPKVSGDDCHETAATQLKYLEDAGFVDVAADWSREFWTLLQGRKP